MVLNLSTPAADGVTRPSDMGYLAWGFDPFYSPGSSALATDGLLYVQKLYTPRAITVTNLHVLVTVAGATLTAGRNFGGLYNAAGTLVGSTADQAAAWVSTGHKTMALAGGPFTIAAGNFYTALYANGTTRPTMARGFGGFTIPGAGAGTTTSRYLTADTGLTTALPATLGAFTTSTLPFWTAVS